MKQWKMLLGLEIKRAMKNLKKLMLGASVIAVVVVIIVICCASLRKEKGIVNKTAVALVTNNNSVIESVGLDVLNNMETAQNMLDCKVLGEEEARAAFESGEAQAIIIFPDNYIDEIGRGDNVPAQVFLRSNGMTFAVNMIAELCDAAGRLLGGAESASYALVDMLREYKVTEHYDEMVEERDVISARIILSRDDNFDKVTLVGESDVSIVLGYGCSAIIILILLWGLSCGTVLKSDSPVLTKKLEASLISVPKQVTFKAVALLCLLGTMLVMLITVLLASYPWASEYFKLIDVDRFSKLVLLCLSFVPCLLLATMIILFSYLVADNQIGGTLLLFVLTIAMGYCSGCLLPTIFLPKAVRGIGQLLPTFYMRELTTSAAMGMADVKSLIIIVLYSLLFFIVSVCAVTVKGRRV